MNFFYDDFEVIQKLDRRNNSQYYRLRCMVCGHIKECNESNLKRQDNHHSPLNCKEDFYSPLIGKMFGDYSCVGIECCGNRGYVARLRCSICGRESTSHAGSIRPKFHNAFTCEEMYYKWMVGRVYGDLEVIEWLGCNQYGEAKYKCRCIKCGIESEQDTRSLKKGIAHGTHCLKLIPDSICKRTVIVRFYDMYQRCNNPKHKAYKRYGARGIKLLYKHPVDLYMDFKDELEAYAKIHGWRNSTFDRIDVNGDYEKENLRIATQKIQSTNTRRKKIFIIEKDGNRILSDSGAECARYVGMKSASAMNNMIGGRSKSTDGWKLVRFVSENEDIDEVCKMESVTTKLIVA